MKILKVVIRNLNSLKGDHVIDFGKEPLASAGLYAITGSTGSGKSTILDAITLAFFGKAARYGNEANPEDMMTRGTSDCSAEVTFEVKKGVFITQWSLMRARGKVEGKVQPPSRRVMTQGGKILAEQVKDANKTIEDIIGLDHEQFMRSVMLAQGQFAKFLTAKPDERAQLLESLTGSEIYSKIGAMAFEEAGRIEQGILDREAEIQKIVLLTDDDKIEIKNTIEELEANKKRSREELSDLATVKARIVQLEKSERDAEAHALKLGEAEDERLSMAKEFKALIAHQETIPFTAVLTQLDVAEETLVGARSAFTDAGDELSDAKESLSQGAGDYQASIKLAIRNATEALKQSESDKKSAEKRLTTISAWLDAHKQDAQLATKLAKFSKLISLKDSADKKLTDAWESWTEQVSETLSRTGTKIPKSVTSLDSKGLDQHIQLVKDVSKDLLDKALSNQTTAKKTLSGCRDAKQATLLLQKYEQDRASLVDGDPCNLCGSIHHPYAGKNIKASPAAKIEKDIEAALVAVTRADTAVNACNAEITAVSRLGKQLSAAHSQAITQSAENAKLLKTAGFEVTDDSDALQQRADDYTAKKDEHANIQTEIKDASIGIQSANKELAELAKRQGSGLNLPDGIKSSTDFDEDLEIDDAETAFDEALKAYNAANTVYGVASKAIKTAEASQKQAMGELERKIEKSNFKSVKALREAHLPGKDVERLSKRKEAIDRRISDSKILFQEAEKTLAALVKDGVPRGASAEKVKSRHGELVELLNVISTDITTNRATISTDDENRKIQKRLLVEIEEESKEIFVWRRLRDLIGSKDGAKFRKFAQSITLQILTGHANKHLGRLNDRYALLLDEGDSLELQIEDYYQAGIRRPLASLSGGESFLASLALALGLSDLAGRSVNIETLFIDEGFGTLDPETLEAALTALETLRQGNKSVGVISHVGLLKERITTQIQVNKMTSGHSTLTVV
jgi:exonuclease SbcC